MKAIYKYKILPAVYTMMPPGAQPLSVGQQGADIVCWAIVDTELKPTAQRRILGLGTGHPDPTLDGQFIGTVQLDNGLVYHFFDQGEEGTVSEDERR